MEGLEPTTCWLQISCSSQLSYIGLYFFQKKARFKRIANVNIYFFNQNKLYFFLIRKSNKNQDLLRGWDFLKTFLISSMDLFV